MAWSEPIRSVSTLTPHDAETLARCVVAPASRSRETVPCSSSGAYAHVGGRLWVKLPDRLVIELSHDQVLIALSRLVLREAKY